MPAPVPPLALVPVAPGRPARCGSLTPEDGPRPGWPPGCRPGSGGPPALGVPEPRGVPEPVRPPLPGVLPVGPAPETPRPVEPPRGPGTGSAALGGDWDGPAVP